MVELLSAQERVDFAVGCPMPYNCGVWLMSGSLPPLPLDGVTPACRTTTQKLCRCYWGPGLASHLHIEGMREGCVAVAMTHIGCVPHLVSCLLLDCGW